MRKDILCICGERIANHTNGLLFFNTSPLPPSIKGVKTPNLTLYT